MKLGNANWGKYFVMAVLLIAGGSMNAAAGWFGIGGTSWKEEVLLHDGKKIVVNRSVERGGRHEIGQQPPIKEQELSIVMPDTEEEIIWKSDFSESVGYAELSPIAIGTSNENVYVVASPVGCNAYNKWGRPNPPYVIFKRIVKDWKRITLQELPLEISKPNLIISSPDTKVGRLAFQPVSVEAINKFNSSLQQPEYQSILREPLPQQRIIEMCGDMVQYRGHWIMRNSELDKLRIDRILDERK